MQTLTHHLLAHLPPPSPNPTHHKKHEETDISRKVPKDSK